MNDTDLSQQFIRQKTVGGPVHMLVRVVGWNGPANPVSRWIVAAKIKAIDFNLDGEISRILRDEHNFGVCKECGGRNPQRWMHGTGERQSCAEARHGVVH